MGLELRAEGKRAMMEIDRLSQSIKPRAWSHSQQIHKKLFLYKIVHAPDRFFMLTTMPFSESTFLHLQAR